MSALVRCCLSLAFQPCRIQQLLDSTIGASGSNHLYHTPCSAGKGYRYRHSILLPSCHLRAVSTLIELYHSTKQSSLRDQPTLSVTVLAHSLYTLSCSSSSAAISYILSLSRSMSRLGTLAAPSNDVGALQLGALLPLAPPLLLPPPPPPPPPLFGLMGLCTLLRLLSSCTPVRADT